MDTINKIKYYLNNNKKILVIITVSTFLIIAIGVSFVLYRQNTNTDSEAGIQRSSATIFLGRETSARERRVNNRNQIGMNIFLETHGPKASAATILVKYDPKKLEFVENSIKNPIDYVGDGCKNLFKLDTLIHYDNNDITGELSITRGAMKPKGELPEGRICFNPLVFNSLVDDGETVISLDDLRNTVVAGPGVVYAPKFSTTETAITINLKPVPTQTPTPTRVVTKSPTPSTTKAPPLKTSN